jgi:hypothetical protein
MSPAMSSARPPWRAPAWSRAAWHIATPLASTTRPARSDSSGPSSDPGDFPGQQTEEECKNANIPYPIVGFKDKYGNHARSQIIGDTEGMIRSSRSSGKLLGCVSARSPAAGHIGLACLSFGGDIDFFIHTVFNYPTLGDIYKYTAYNPGQMNEAREAAAKHDRRGNLAQLKVPQVRPLQCHLRTRLSVDCTLYCFEPRFSVLSKASRDPPSGWRLKRGEQARARVAKSCDEVPFDVDQIGGISRTTTQRRKRDEIVWSHSPVTLVMTRFIKVFVLLSALLACPAQAHVKWFVDVHPSDARPIGDVLTETIFVNLFIIGLRNLRFLLGGSLGLKKGPAGAVG